MKAEGRRKKEEGRRKNYLYFSVCRFSCFSLSLFSSASEVEPLDLSSPVLPGKQLKTNNK